MSESKPRPAIIEWWRRLLAGDGVATRPPGGYMKAHDESLAFGVFVQKEHVHHEPVVCWITGGAEIARELVASEGEAKP